MKTFLINTNRHDLIMPKPKYQIIVSRNADGKFNWTIRSCKNGKTLVTANQGYSRKIDARKQADQFAADFLVPVEVVDKTDE